MLLCVVTRKFCRQDLIILVFTLDSELKEKFARYVDLLAKKGYFTGCEEGSDEYKDRLSKAEQRFVSKYSNDNPTKVPAPSSSSSAPAPTPTPVSAPSDKYAGLTDAQKQEKAEALKNEGNQKLSSRQYADAVALYSDAILLNPRNAIYYSNRAAAYSHIGEHQKAITDCNTAIKLDPKYSKAYSRLGLAYFSLGKYREAVEFGYRKALELEPSNAAAKESLAAAEAKIAELEASAAATTPAAAPGGNPFAGLNPDLMRQAMAGLGGAGGSGGGMPDLGSLMSNPQFAQMAQGLMSNPAFMNMFVVCFSFLADAETSDTTNLGRRTLRQTQTSSARSAACLASLQPAATATMTKILPRAHSKIKNLSLRTIYILQERLTISN